MSEWSAQTAATFLRQQYEEDQNAEKYIHINALLNSEAPKFWNAFKAALKGMIEDVNTDLGMTGAVICEESKPDVLEIKTHPAITIEGRPREVKVQFTRHSREISVHGDIKASWIVDLYPNSTSAACLKGQSRNAEPVNVQFIAAGLLEGLLGISKAGCIV